MTKSHRGGANKPPLELDRLLELDELLELGDGELLDFDGTELELEGPPLHGIAAQGGHGAQGADAG